MALYAIGDLHLSFGSNKPMDIFGENWKDHFLKIKANWLNTVKSEDTVILCGDISWAMNFSQLIPDFAFINELSGNKIILKGNHDYWWTTMSKISTFLSTNAFNTIKILHNNAYKVDNTSICGTRGWPYDEYDNSESNKKVLLREVGRLKASLEKGIENDGELIAFLHYPPIYEGYRCAEIMETLKLYKVKRCYFGHLHYNSVLKALQGEHEGINFQLISSDYVNFIPVLICE